MEYAWNDGMCAFFGMMTIIIIWHKTKHVLSEYVAKETLQCDHISTHKQKRRGLVRLFCVV